MNQERVIGSNNQLPWHIPEDLAHFKQVTLGKPIIMGRKTFESIGRILPGRTNIVISRHTLHIPGAEVFNDLERALTVFSQAPEIAIIGGGEIFSQALPKATKLYLTKVNVAVNDPGAYFPEVDYTQWELVERKLLNSVSGIRCEFFEYQKKGINGVEL
jgi:dihydrofolate reductase